jgi:hypothetical protein
VNLSESRNPIAEGLARRLRSLTRVLDRLDRLESGSGEWLANFNDNELPAAAAELTLRALRTASDPINYQILITLSHHATLSLPDLIAATSLTRLPLSERLNDLVQVGLATRLIDTDHAQITASGAEMAVFIRNIIEEVIFQMNNEQ